MKRLAATILLAFSSAAFAQSLGDVAEREKERRKKAPPSTKSFSDRDLPKPKPSASPAPSASPSPTPSPEEPDAKGTEAGWKALARERRGVIEAAQKRVVEIQERIDKMRKGLVQPLPIDAVSQRPPEMSVQSDELRSAEAELEQAKAALAEARKALEVLEEDARRKMVPPGWLRE